MKNVLLNFFFLLVTVGLYAQQGINYKAVIKDAAGNKVVSKAITVQFQLLQGASQTNVYQENHTTTTDINGVIIINIGEGTPNSGVFATINWGIETFLNTQINTGAGFIDSGTTGFTSVPYALQAETANNGMPKGGTVGQVLQIVNGEAVWIAAQATGKLFYEDADGDGYGDINKPIVSNLAPNGYVSNNTDCNDANANLNPGATEIVGNGVDDDCDGQIDEAASSAKIGDFRAGSVMFRSATTRIAYSLYLQFERLTTKQL